jgi:hypothetical protein
MIARIAVPWYHWYVPGLIMLCAVWCQRSCGEVGELLPSERGGKPVGYQLADLRSNTSDTGEKSTLSEHPSINSNSVIYSPITPNFRCVRSAATLCRRTLACIHPIGEQP